MVVQNIKTLFFKIYFNTILLSDNEISLLERLQYIWKSFITFAPIAIVLNLFNLWFVDNKTFFNGVVACIFINMLLGSVMHIRKKTFNILILLKKTLLMIIVVLLTYLVLELVLIVAGSNSLTESFRTVLQVATLIYPISKILKNIFILSNGEHPPKWLMEKIYNFQENGDLSKLLESKSDTE